MLKIWGRRNSINVQKVLWCAAELGLEFQQTDAGLEYGVNTDDWYLRENPNARIPLIDDDGFTLWESNVIVRYLTAKYAPGELCPATPADRADAERWMDWQQTTLNPALTPVFWGLIRTAAEQRDMVKIAAGERDSLAALTLLDAHLDGRDYLHGGRFSVADIPAGASVYRWYKLPIEHPPLPHLGAWYQRLCQRPAFQGHVMLPLS